MQLSQIDELQKNALAKMGFGNHLQEIETEVPGPVFSLLATNTSSGELALGKVGKQLIELVNRLDLHHPDAITFINSVFNDDERFRQQTLETIELADRCKDLSSIAINFPRLLGQNKFVKSNFDTSRYIRLLKSYQERDMVRSEQELQTIDLRAFYKRGNEIWQNQPTDFSIFNRHNIPYIEYLDIAERRASRYAELGCETITDKLTEEIKQLKLSLRDRYYGFNRLTMTVAAAILAKMHGYKLKTVWDIHDNKVLSIIIPTAMLYNFEPTEAVLPFIQGFSNGEYHYEPRLYPIHQLIHTASESMINLVAHLDNFPDMNGKTLFDNFLILVPSVKLPQNYNGTYFVRDKNGNTLGFNDKNDAVKFLDMTLIESHSVQPVLLGERNGKLYFISYWR